MPNRTTGAILIVVGLAIALVFALADVFGLGQTPGQFGTRQIVGTVVGVLVIIAGAVIYRRQG